jgi:dienelactone hydrolase
MQVRRRTPVVVVAAVIVAVAAGCVPPTTTLPRTPPPSTSGPNPDDAPRAGDAAYVGPGPYAAGVRTVQLERGRQAEIWYPAPPASTAGLTPDSYHITSFLSPFLRLFIPPSIDPTFTTTAFRDVPVAAGRFPLVLFAHGFASYRLQSTFLTAHLASWGFVVISPDYPERGLSSLFGSPTAPTRSNASVAQLAVSEMVALDTGDDPLAGHVDTSRLFPVGHSAGGGASMDVAGRRTDVQSWISLSSGINAANGVPAALRDPTKAALWMVGADDHVVQPGSVQQAFDYTAGPRKLVVIPASGHNNAMSDICEIGKDRGGLIGIARSIGLALPDFITTLAQDGCTSPSAPSSEVWPIVRQFVTAELRYRAGLDAEPVGLGSSVVDHLGPVVPTYSHNP